MQEPQGSGDKLEKKLNSIMNEVDTLKNEVPLCVLWSAIDVIVSG